MENFLRNLYLIMRNKLIISSFTLLFALSAWAQTSVDGNMMAAENTFTNQSIEFQNKIEIYPNPAVDYVVVHIDNSTLTNTEIEVHSIIGNTLSIEVEDLGDGRFRIPVKDFASGYYFVVVKDEVSRFKKAYRFLKK